MFDAENKGVSGRIEPSGNCTFYAAYKNSQGKRRRYKIGRYGNLTVAQARDIAAKTSAKVAMGIDPQEERDQTTRKSSAREISYTRCVLK